MKRDRLFRSAVGACILTLLCAVWKLNSSAEPTIVDEQKIAGWTLDAITDDSNDHVICSIDQGNGHDMLLFGVMVEHPSRVWSLTLSSLGDDKPFKVGAAYSITYAIDGGAEVTVRAEGFGTPSVFRSART
ncbi:hypothetical protein [Dongia sp.]|uniref:hypothetical protein n=1 Tax=Dongia sp. TaxID=1977262 RepID=UPI00375024C8